MQYIEGLKEYTDTGKSAVTFGKFDGLHRGHQKLVDKVKGYGESDGIKTVVCAFDMPGRQVIMTADDRKRYLRLGGFSCKLSVYRGTETYGRKCLSKR